MDRSYRCGDETLAVSARLDAARIHVATAGGERTFEWDELGPGDYLLRAGVEQRRCVVARSGDDRWVWVEGRVHHLKAATASGRRASVSAGSLTSPMPGQVVRVLVRAGDDVVKGQVLVVLEAMKMQYEIVAPHDGVVESLHATEGDQVAGGVGLVTLAAGGA